ncbi:MAG TPA: CAP domain-containing protein [Pyrinomonadaceae bacterium]
MIRNNSFPRIAARTPAGLFLLCSLVFAALAATAVEGFAQSSSGRPVARLITAYDDAPVSAPTRHHTAGAMAAEPAAPAVAATSLERRAFDLVNAERVRQGLPPLVWDGSLCRVARLHSENMGRLNFFDHHAPDGTSLLDRARRGNIRWRSLGENIAFNQGFDDPVTLAVNQWMHSQGHRENILRRIFTHSAVGIARTSDGRVYLTQVFATR